MRLLILFIAVAFFQSVPYLAHSQSEISVDSLADATALRPIDLVASEPGWNSASPDMYSFWINNGLYGNYGPQPKILLDSLPVDVNFFGWQNLNMLPIYLPDLSQTLSLPETVEYSNTFSPAGFINFSGKSPDPGLAAGASVYLGNESGDPGPWVYDSTRVTPNVDRWGPDAGGLISFAKGQWFSKGIFVLKRHQQTDPISHRRLHRIDRALGATRFYPIQTNSQSGLFETGYKAESWNIKVRGVLAEDRNYIFLQPLGREVPAQADYQQLALDARYIPDRWEFHLRYISDHKKLDRLNSEHDYVFNWNELNNQYSASASYNNDDYNLTGSLSLDHKKVKAPGMLKESYPIWDFYLSTVRQSGEKNRYQLITRVELHQNQAAKTFKGVLKEKPLDHWTIEMNARYSEILPIRQQSFGYWITQGYNFHEELGITTDQPLSITNNRLGSLSLENNFRLADAFSLALSQQLTRHYDLNIPWQSVTYSTNFDSEPGTFSITQESGTRISLQGNLLHHPESWFNQSLSIRFQQSLQGSQRYKDYFRQIPAGQIHYKLDVSPATNLVLTFQGTYRSSTQWKEFDSLDGETYREVDNLFPILTGTFDSTVPAHFNIDLGAKKWFWQKRLSLQITVQNLLNEEMRLHPMGADRSFMFNIKATAGF